MKILAIRGRNLASLAGAFEVDFTREPLKSAGLFAICGPTGAGKSTLLDALCLALYDATPRLAQAPDSRFLPDAGGVVSPQNPATLLRRGAFEGYAEADFTGNDGLRYRARWEVQRAGRKPTGSLKSAELSLTCLNDGQPIGGTKSETRKAIQERIGLSFSQFTRAVLLAQNDFAAFLKADEQERGKLLETLTGTALYTVISQKAHERNKQEQEDLNGRRRQLESCRPLDAPARAALEAERDHARNTALALAAEQERLERHLHWHRNRAAARLSEQEAQRGLDQAAALWDRAEPRRLQLARIDAAQPAAALLKESRDRARDVADSLAAVAAGERDLAEAGHALREAEAAFRAAREQAAAAARAQRDALPDLDRAKALDGEIAVLAKAHAERRQEREAARREQDAAARRLAGQHRDREKLASEREATAAWLEGNAPLRPLADGWPRWDELFRQATATAGEAAEIRRHQAEAETALAECRARHEAATAARVRMAASFQEADTAYGAADRHHAAFDGPGLAAERRDAETRRDRLRETERLWRELRQAGTRRAELETAVRDLDEARRGAEAELAAIAAEKPLALARCEQARRALETARLAVAERVEDLRAGLEPGRPCPVCGATEHPYATDNPDLRGVFAALAAEAATLEAEAARLSDRESERKADLRNFRRRRDETEPALAAATAERDRLEAAWRDHPGAAELAAVAEAERSGRLAAQSAELETRRAELAALEDQARAAADRRELARRDRDAARDALNRAERAEDGAAAALRQAEAARVDALKARERIGRKHEEILVHLDPVLPEPDWRAAWRQDPAECHRTWQARAEEFLARRNALAERDLELAALDREIAVQAEALAKLGEALLSRAESFRQADEDLRERRAERAGLFGGRPAGDVENALQAAVADAEAQVREGRERTDGARSRQDAVAARLEETRKLLGQRRTAADRADRALAVWLEAHNAGEPAATPLDPEGLAALLAHDGGWIAAERRDLQALADALNTARAVLGDRRRQREALEAERPLTESAETLERRRDEWSRELKAVDARRIELEIRLRADDERHAQAVEIKVALERQEAVADLWARLNELIGSHDGKKFRNYAQQLTLDVLLGYANRHLADLTRRYRLERVPDKLALMVVDRDMGDEKRSVHSLSGGESFLVSLALALGLASLSSNRVRVESLFIDEGFGSLDAETLTVAMDALDRLHALGRKVGVISHVQEMTERIGTRIRVERQAGGRSRVVVG
jgi:exonuclease SbcC